MIYCVRWYFLMYTMSLHIYHATIYFILISVFDRTNSQNISVIRGERDVFTNPEDCTLAKAACLDRNCTYCQCKNSGETFVATRRKYGECVANEHLDYVMSFNSSFLIQETTKKLCLVRYKIPRLRFVQYQHFSWEKLAFSRMKKRVIFDCA